MEIKQILDKIESNKSIQQFPKTSGIYVMYAKNNIIFDFITINKGEIIYIGKSESSLSDRKTKQHFSSESTGRSTVRRSLGAILKKEFDIKCFLRGKGKSKNDSNCYIFDKESEIRLTNWMNENISMSFFVTNNPEEIEVRLIAKYNPILNLKEAEHNFITHIKDLRTKCKDEAEQNGVLK
jgi:excinuclease UvrABC nuclease subunit